VSFPFTTILTAHVSGRLREADKERDEIVIAIPNELDEFGQDGLLRDLRRHGFQKVQLVWRPVAVALGWLERTQNAFPRDIPSDDFIIVVHLGPDCMEFVPLRLREKELQGKRYVIPLREPPKIRVPLAGCDWAADLLESAFRIDDPGAFWQAFTGFPEIWATLAQKAWSSEELPRAWNRGNSWDLWDPEESIWERMLDLEARSSKRLTELLNGSCRVERPASSGRSWVDLIQANVKEAAETYTGRLRGMILSGPLVSSSPAPWLAGITAFLEEKGLQVAPSSEAAPERIWISGLDRDAVSEGAAIYGARLKSEEPTYLDTLPELSIWAQERGRLAWFPLVKAQEVEGGQPYEDRLDRKFSLPATSRSLQFFLGRGKESVFKKASVQFPYPPGQRMPMNTHVWMYPASGLARVEFIPINRDFLRGHRVFLDYSTMEEVTEAELPKRKLGSPPITNMLVDPADSKILSENFEMVCENFLNSSIRDPQYHKIVGSLKNVLNTPIRFQSSLNRWVNGRIVDKDGKAKTPRGQNLIDRVSAKLGSDLQELLDHLAHRSGESRRQIEAIRHIRQAAGWLFGGASSVVISYLKAQLEGSEQTRTGDVLEAAGRCFVERHDIELLYKVILQGIQYPIPKRQRFPEFSARAIYRVLELREQALNAMRREDAENFVRQAVINMEECVNRRNFKRKFFQFVKLFLYLLRYRENDQSFLSDSNDQEQELFDRMLSCLESARGHFQDERNYRTARRVMDLTSELERYRIFEGSEDILEVIDELAGSDDN